jgi:hypothetical protein
LSDAIALESAEERVALKTLTGTSEAAPLESDAAREPVKALADQ